MSDGDDTSELEQKLLKYSKVGVPVATIVGMLVAGYLQGPPLAVLVLATGALIGVVSALWASLRALLGETPLTGADAFVMAAPRAEEEQKRAVLRALKDIEFERGVGKISEEDYRELQARYRAEAKRLLQELDEAAGPRRASVEALVAKRLEAAGLGEDQARADGGAGSRSLEEDDTPDDAATDEPSAVVESRKAKKKKRKKLEKERAAAEAARASEDEDESDEPTAGRACIECGTMNDTDAVFCKKCGHKQEVSA